MATASMPGRPVFDSCPSHGASAVKSTADSLRWIGSLDAASISAALTAAADIGILLDRDGIIQGITTAGSEQPLPDTDDWIGLPLTETVTVECKAKAEALLRSARTGEQSRSRHLNHVVPDGPDLPILYRALAVGDQGWMVAIGRDMRALADLQQRLVDTQQAVDREYAELRHLETRYRLVLRMSSEAVVVVDARTREVVEANPAATALLGIEPGRRFPETLGESGNGEVQALLAKVQSLGKVRCARVNVPGQVGEQAGEIEICASLFRSNGTGQFLVRAAPASVAPTSEPEHAALLDLVAAAPDGFVVTGADGTVLDANEAFLDLAQIASLDQVRGVSLDHWLGRPGVDLNVLTASLREHRTVKLFSTTLRSEHGTVEPVEISAASIPADDGIRHGFVIRPVSRRPGTERGRPYKVPQSADQLKEMVGRVPLKELVRETTDLIERLCIEAALEITGDNRASAAEMLALSRQSLYVKLRRYGLVSDADDPQTQR